MCSHGICFYGTWNVTLLLSFLPPEVVTVTVPLVAPPGTLVVISEAETTLNLAAVPLKLTAAAPARLVPRVITFAPGAPDVGMGPTTGRLPAAKAKNVTMAALSPHTADT